MGSVDLFETSGAILSECGRYRYRLDRRWGPGPVMGFIMLNPSTADASQNDPTIRRCIGFAKREGCGALMVVNLFAFRATEPKAMMVADDPRGPENMQHVVEALNIIDGPLIAAWGTGGAHMRAGEKMAEWIGWRLQCLGVTKGGHPKHPLYVKSDAKLMTLL